MQITLSLEPGFKRSITYEYRDDSTIQDDFAAHAARHEFADITWYPSQRTAMYRVDDRAPLSVGITPSLGVYHKHTSLSGGSHTHTQETQQHKKSLLVDASHTALIVFIHINRLKYMQRITTG